MMMTFLNHKYWTVKNETYYSSILNLIKFLLRYSLRLRVSDISLQVLASVARNAVKSGWESRNKAHCDLTRWYRIHYHRLYYSILSDSNSPLTQVHFSCSSAHSFFISTGMTLCVNLKNGFALWVFAKNKKDNKNCRALRWAYVMNFSSGQNSSQSGSISAWGSFWPNQYITRTSRPLKTWFRLTFSIQQLMAKLLSTD